MGWLVGKAILTPKPIELGTILSIAVGNNVSAMAAPDDEDLSQFMVRKVLPVAFDISVSGFENHVAAFTIIDGFKNRLVALVYPALSQVPVIASMI